MVTNIKSEKQYTLQVSWPRLSDKGNSPEYIKRQLDIDNVAERMRTTENGEHFAWGFGTQAF
jgi:hypothetical protein